jgi:nicotinamidase-related amidase
MNDPKLSPSDAIFVFADLHKGIVDLPLTMPRSELLRAVEGMATLAELFDIPTFALSIPKLTGQEVEFVPELAATRSRFTHLQRTSPDSFDNAAIRDAFAATGRRTLVVSGVATEVVVHWLVLSGRANGYSVYVVTDACGGLSVRSESAALARFTAAGAAMTSVASLAGEFSGDFTRPLGRAAVEVIYRMIGVRGPGH